MAQPSSSSPDQGDNASSGPQASPPGQPPSAQSPQDGSQGGGPISQLLDQVGGALQHLNQVFAASKSIEPDEQKMMAQIVGMYGQLMQSLSGSGGDDEAQEQGQPGGAQGQTAPMEAAGNKGAQPVM